MRVIYLYSFVLWGTVGSAQNPFRLDLFGYLPAEVNRVVVADPQVGFNANDSYTPSQQLLVVGSDYSVPITATAWFGGATDERSGDAGWVIELPELPTGTYHIVDLGTGAESPDFEISQNVYNQALKDAVRMFFHNRCGAAKTEADAGPWHDGVAFNNPGQDTECKYIYDSQDASLFRDVRGGWFDAGDYNKYVTYAERPVFNLMEA